MDALTSDIRVIVQARIGSSRLPAKVLYDLNGQPAIFWILTRLTAVFDINHIYLAIPDGEDNNILSNIGHSVGVNVVTGPESCLISRFCQVPFGQSTLIARICSDNWFLSPWLLKEDLLMCQTLELDYLDPFSNPKIPFGLKAEVARGAVLQFLLRNVRTLSADEREHLFLMIRQKKTEFVAADNLSIDGISTKFRPRTNLSVDLLSQAKAARAVFARIRGSECATRFEADASLFNDY